MDKRGGISKDKLASELTRRSACVARLTKALWFACCWPEIRRSTR